MAHMSKSEKRWQEGLGERYLKIDPNRVRCQGVSKSKLRMIRIREGEPTLDSDSVWPEGQCSRAAEEGTFLCTLHGGRSPNIAKKRITDFMPVDLKEKFEVFENNPDLISRYVEMAQLQARNAQLYEQMDELVLGEDGWETVTEGVKLIERGEVAQGCTLIRIALGDTKKETESWREIRANNAQIAQLHTIQITTEEKLKTMATMDQVKAIVNGAFQSLRYILENNLEDRNQVGRILMLWAADLRQIVGAKRVGGLLDE